MESSIPYVVLGVLYAYLLYLSWTPDTLRLMFASKYWLPEVYIHTYVYINWTQMQHQSNILKVLMIVGVNQLFQFDIINNIAICAATWHGKDVLQWDNFSFCLDSLVGCGSLCRKVSLSLSLSHALPHTPQSLLGIYCTTDAFVIVALQGTFSRMGCKMKLKLVIQSLFAFFFVQSESLLMSSPKHWQKALGSTRRCTRQKLMQKQHTDGFIN